MKHSTNILDKLQLGHDECVQSQFHNQDILQGFEYYYHMGRYFQGNNP